MIPMRDGSLAFLRCGGLASRLSIASMDNRGAVSDMVFGIASGASVVIRLAKSSYAAYTMDAVMRCVQWLVSAQGIRGLVWLPKTESGRSY